MSIPVVGTILSQPGPTFGAKIIIAGASNVKQPTWVRYEPPRLAFRTVKGRPIYAGLPVVTCHWDAMSIDTYQALSTIFFPILNSDDGPIVDILWPDPAQAGRYVYARAYMEWPAFQRWQEAWIRDVECRLSSFSYPGQGIFF